MNIGEAEEEEWCFLLPSRYESAINTSGKTEKHPFYLDVPCIYTIQMKPQLPSDYLVSIWWQAKEEDS